MPNSHLFNALFAISLAGPTFASISASPLPPSIAANATHTGWVNGPNSGRGTETIIWQCISTIVLCVYVANHLAIPFEALSGKMAFLRKTFWVTIGLLFPEWMCSIAFSDWAAARALVQRCIALGCPVSQAQAFVINACGVGVRNLHLLKLDDGEGAEVHSESTQPSQTAVGSPDVERGQPSERFRVPKSYETGTVWFCGIDLEPDGSLTVMQLSDDNLRLIASVIPTGEEISSRTKANGVAKLLTLLQTTWSLVQVISRWAQHLEISLMEYATLAYVVMTMTSYCFWFHKPYDVESPFIVDMDRDSEIIGRPVDIKAWRTTHDLGWRKCKSSARKLEWIYDLEALTGDGGIDGRYIALVVGLSCAVFGGIHGLAWYYGFSTLTEAWLWRVFAVLTVVLPIALILLAQLGHEDILVESFLAYLLIILYLLLRMYMIIECFVAFRDAPVGIYRKVSWTSYWPHFGG